MKMIIVGLMGGIGHGKTTFANYLASSAKKYRHWETSEIVSEVANALRHEHTRHPKPNDIPAINEWLSDLDDIVTTCTHANTKHAGLLLTNQRLKRNPENYYKLFEYLDAMQKNPNLQIIDITPSNKQIFRALLQWLGGYLIETVNEGIWYDEIVRRLRQSAAEGLDLATVGGVRYPADAERLRNAGGFIIKLERLNHLDIDINDLTERQQQDIKPDTTIINNAPLINLKYCAQQVYNDLQTRNIQPIYKASNFNEAF